MARQGHRRDRNPHRGSAAALHTVSTLLINPLEEASSSCDAKV